jgi:hypothetical protein
MTRYTEGLGRVLAGMLIATAVAFGLAACGDNADRGEAPGNGMSPSAATQNTPSDDDENRTYNGAYDKKFRDWAGDHEDAIVTLTGTVKTVVNGNAFTLAGEDGAEDFLVVSKDVSKGLTSGSDVSITGIVHKAFDLPAVKDEIDVDFDDDTVFEGFDRDPYVVASNISTE